MGITSQYVPTKMGYSGSPLEGLYVITTVDKGHHLKVCASGNGVLRVALGGAVFVAAPLAGGLACAHLHELLCCAPAARPAVPYATPLILGSAAQGYLGLDLGFQGHVYIRGI